MRTHPELEGRGIAARLHDYLLDLWLQIGSGTLRLATASFRLPVQHLCERTGFEKLGEFSDFGAPALAETVNSFLPLSTGELDEGLEAAITSESLAFSNGLMDLSWRWASPSQAFLAEAAGKGKAWWWGDRQGLLVLTEDSDDDGKVYPMVELLACSNAAVPALLEDYRRLAALQGFEQARWAAPLHPGLLPLLEAAGFRREWDAAIFIYAKKHPVV